MSRVWKASLACISLALLAICLDITEAAALTIFGGIASTAVAFFVFSRFVYFLTCDCYKCTGEISKFDTLAFSLIFSMLGVCHV